MLMPSGTPGRGRSSTVTCGLLDLQVAGDIGDPLHRVQLQLHLRAYRYSVATSAPCSVNWNWLFDDVRRR